MQAHQNLVQTTPITSFTGFRGVPNKKKPRRVLTFLTTFVHVPPALTLVEAEIGVTGKMMMQSTTITQYIMQDKLALN